MVVLQGWKQPFKAVQHKLPRNRTFGELLAATSKRDATDPWDKIFALVGLLPDQSDDWLLPDYNQSVSETYQRAMLTVLRCKKGLDFSKYAMVERRYKLPSWCIDFAARNWFMDRPLDGRIGIGRASGQAPRSSVVQDEKRTGVTISGAEIGRIECVSKRGDSPWSSGSSLESLKVMDVEEKAAVALRVGKQFVKDMLPFASASFEALDHRLGYSEACKLLSKGIIWRTAAHGMTFNYLANQLGIVRHNLPEDYSCIQRYVYERYWRWQIFSSQWSHMVREVPTELLIWTAFVFPAFALETRDCTFFTTDNGYIGKAEGQKVQSGDLLCILFGCGYPVVLRPSGDSYRLITSTWVHDVMDGEFVEDYDRVEKHSFRLV